MLFNCVFDILYLLKLEKELLRMEITINGEKRQLVGNPPAVGDEFPHFKVFDKNGDKVKTRQLLGKITLLSVVPDINTPVCLSLIHI